MYIIVLNNVLVIFFTLNTGSVPINNANVVSPKENPGYCSMTDTIIPKVIDINILLQTIPINANGEYTKLIKLVTIANTITSIAVSLIPKRSAIKPPIVFPINTSIGAINQRLFIFISGEIQPVNERATTLINVIQIII